MDVEGRNASILANKFPEMSFRYQVNRHEPQTIASPRDTLLVYLVRNILWNHSDAECIKILRAFEPAMRKSPGAVLLVNEMLSPAPGTFERNVEKSYRRRDVTVLTMHNAKQRTEDEWRALFVEASPDFKVSALLTLFLWRLLNISARHPNRCYLSQLQGTLGGAFGTRRRRDNVGGTEFEVYLS